MQSMQRQTTLSIWCERILEAGWLAIMALIPIYFNLLSARHFEPDKATTLRAIVLFMAAIGIIRVLELISVNPAPANPTADDPAAQTNSNPFAGLWKWLNSVPLLVPALLYALVFLFTTFTSVVPHTSFWGSYQRLQGTYTNLSYIGLFLIIVATMRRREQLERLIVVVLMTGLAVACYGMLQHFGLDPLPWRGNVIERVASTMGNSIFVAAYLLMVVPFALFWLLSRLSMAASAPAPQNTRTDLLWVLVFSLIVVGTLALLLAVIKFGSIVRTADFRYWWVFPGAVLISTALWTLLGPRQADDNSPSLPLWPGALYAVYMLFFGATFAASSGSPNVQVLDERITNGMDWWIWLLTSVAAIGVAYGLGVTLPRRAPQPSRLSLWIHAAAAGGATLAMLATIFFSQSRGPFIGLGAGLFVFFMLLLIQAIARAKGLGQLVLLQRLRILLWSWVGLVALAGGFLIIFNTTYTPFFNQLREVPYVGRLGQLLITDYGTGRVRVLIWAGDEHAGGAMELITADPVRALIGWGPESMFVAYNPFYPPSLAQIESRGASPDRSHQAILDELVTKGLLGLMSYFFVLFSFGMLAWRMVRQSKGWYWQVFFIATIAIIVGHFVEGLTGIPIVSTLTMFWTTLALTVVAGQMAGHYVIGKVAQPVLEPEPTPVEAEPEAPTASGKRKKRGSQQVGRGATASALRTGASRSGSRAPAPNQTNPAKIGLYSMLIALTLGAVWWFNLSTVYADMRFHEGQAFSEQPSAGLNEQVIALSKFAETINRNPREDFYYLNLGRTLMTIAQQQQAQGVPSGEPLADPDLSRLLRISSPQDAANFVQTHTPMQMMSYAEAVLDAARELNPMNKDHYANLARLNNFWYNWTQDITRLQAATEWYGKANTIAPQDVVLLNEHASVLLILGGYYSSIGDTAQATATYDRAEALLERSWSLDKLYADTPPRLAELYRVRGDLERATEMYLAALDTNPHALDPYAQQIIDSLAAEPELTEQLAAKYIQIANKSNDSLLNSIAALLAVRINDLDTAIELYGKIAEREPTNLDNLRNYTIVLSDSNRYAEALDQAEIGLAQAQVQEGRDLEIAQFEYLVELFKQKVAGGQ